MKSTLMPNPLVVVAVFFIVCAAVAGYVTGRIQGNTEIQALEAQYAEENKEAAKAVSKLVDDIKADFELRMNERTNEILNNMHSGS